MRSYVLCVAIILISKQINAIGNSENGSFAFKSKVYNMLFQMQLLFIT